MRWLTDIDIVLTKRFFSRPAWLLPMMQAVSFLGQPFVIMSACGLLGIGAYINGQTSIGLGFGLCLIALAGGGLLKGILKRERPDSLYARGMRIKSFSFPSGHALGTLVLYGYIAALVCVFAPQFTLPALLACGAVVLLTGFARVYLGAHYVGDVLGGWLLGTLALFTILTVSL